MSGGTISDVCNRLQICSLALESIDEDTDRAIVMQRIQNVLKQIGIIGDLLHNKKTDPNSHLGSTEPT